MRGHARVSALIRQEPPGMDIVQLREHHLRRARAHPLILSTILPAEAMPPSGHPLILSKEQAATVATSASMSSPRQANVFLVLVIYGSSSAGELISPMIPFSLTSTKIGSFSGITFSSASTEVGDARFLEERMGTRPTNGILWFLVRLSVSWSLGFAVLGARSSWGSHAHPLASCFVSLALLALLVSRISSVYLSKVAQFLARLSS